MPQHTDPVTVSPTQRLLTTAWHAVGGDPAHLAALTTTGDPDGLLPARLHALPAATAAVGAATLAAAVLDATCTGRADPRPAVVDVEHVAVAAVSERHARTHGTPPTDPAGLFAPLSRFWRTADGWLRLHANYPWHRERALAVLGTTDRPDDVAAAVARRSGTDLEDALATAGAVGHAVRTPAEWAAHPQGRATAAAPLVETTAHDGAPLALAPGRAADGVRVLDLTRVIAGPVATRTLAAWGADVLRLDSPHLPDLAAGLTDTLPGKRSALLDLAAPGSRDVLDHLLAGADVVVHGYRPGALHRLGLAPDELRERHPHLVVAAVSAWGGTGPWAHRRGFDSVVQAPTGIAATEGDDDGPGALPAQVLDHATGYLLAAAVLLALAEAATTGRRRHLRLALGSTARWLTDAGTTERPATARAVDPTPYLVTLDGGPHRVDVVAPPGHLADLTPRWTRTTAYGADAPRWLAGR